MSNDTTQRSADSSVSLNSLQPGFYKIRPQGATPLPTGGFTLQFDVLEAVLPEEFERYGIELDERRRPVLRFMQGIGCEQCHKTGYSGRVAIMEVLEITPNIQEVIIDHRGSEAKIIEEVKAQHMLSMRQDGILKALKGLTTLVEVERATSGNLALLEIEDMDEDQDDEPILQKKPDDLPVDPRDTPDTH